MDVNSLFSQVRMVLLIMTTNLILILMTILNLKRITRTYTLNNAATPITAIFTEENFPYVLISCTMIFINIRYVITSPDIDIRRMDHVGRAVAFRIARV